MRKERVDTLDLVHDLRDPEVDDEARERERIGSPHVVLASHELEHRVERNRGRLVEIFVEAEGRPGLGRPGDRGADLELAES